MADKRDLIKIAAPIAAIAATWGARQALGAGYRKATGTPPPRNEDIEVPLRKVLIFAVLSAVAASVANVLITRAVTRATATATSSHNPAAQSS
ncbi:MAG: DUF4235 domain-containing protein [Actinomycetota bacterium]|nr:MAG: DUF4235 domain-containing protein [Actinomycetota bacterium]